jgi:hypothetical protein
MHEEKAKASYKLNTRSAALAQSVSGVALEKLYVGDVMVDDDSVEWIVRQCFCERVECSGKTFKRLEGKEDMDVWDRGKPTPTENFSWCR